MVINSEKILNPTN